MITGAISNHWTKIALERIKRAIEEKKVEPITSTDNHGGINERNSQKGSTAQQGK